MRIEFEWDPAKASTNKAKHGVEFEEAMALFADPLALSRLDDDAPIGEERWVTLGRNARGRLLVVVHTHVEVSGDTIEVRIISARAATRSEVRQYERSGIHDMKEEYDFTGAEDGRFYRKDAVLVPPIHLKSDVLALLIERAHQDGASLEEVVDRMLRDDIAREKATG